MTRTTYETAHFAGSEYDPREEALLDQALSLSLLRQPAEAPPLDAGASPRNFRAGVARV
jgi:hypothetical protein